MNIFCDRFIASHIKYYALSPSLILLLSSLVFFLSFSRSRCLLFTFSSCFYRHISWKIPICSSSIFFSAAESIFLLWICKLMLHFWICIEAEIELTAFCFISHIFFFHWLFHSNRLKVIKLSHSLVCSLYIQPMVNARIVNEFIEYLNVVQRQTMRND